MDEAILAQINEDLSSLKDRIYMIDYDKIEELNRDIESIEIRLDTAFKKMSEQYRVDMYYLENKDKYNMRVANIDELNEYIKENLNVGNYECTISMNGNYMYNFHITGFDGILCFIDMVSYDGAKAMLIVTTNSNKSSIDSDDDYVIHVNIDLLFKYIRELIFNHVMKDNN